jgi:dephospho-CoA kinase
VAARPVAVAITGGIGAGKSEALKAFARHGAAVLSSDEVVHRLLRDDEEVREAVLAELGPGVLDADGRIDRKAVGRLVFGDPARLAWLEGVLHPRVARENLRWQEELSRLPEPPRVSVTEVPLLYEVGAETRFDAVVVITAPPDVRTARSPHATEERTARLLPEEEKVARADFVFVNDGSLADLDAFVADVMESLS